MAFFLESLLYLVLGLCCLVLYGKTIKDGRFRSRYIKNKSQSYRRDKEPHRYRTGATMFLLCGVILTWFGLSRIIFMF